MVRYSELWADVESIKREKGCGDRQACRLLIKRALDAKTGRYLPGSGVRFETAVASLESRFREARVPKQNEAAIAFDFQCDRVGREKAITLLIKSFGTAGIRH